MHTEPKQKPKLLGFKAQKALVGFVDKLRGGTNRSEFMRKLTCDYLEAHGVVVPEEYRHAPDRAGKGGPRRKNQISYARTMPEAARLALNEAHETIKPSPRKMPPVVPSTGRKVPSSPPPAPGSNPQSLSSIPGPKKRVP